MGDGKGKVEMLILILLRVILLVGWSSSTSSLLRFSIGDRGHRRSESCGEGLNIRSCFKLIEK